MPVQSDWNKGVYWIDFLTDVLYSVKSFRQEGYSVSQYIKPYTRPHVFADYDAKDLGPFIKRIKNSIKRSYNHVVH